MWHGASARSANVEGGSTRDEATRTAHTGGVQLRALARRRGQFADLRYPATPTLAHMSTRAVDGTDFRPSRNGDGAVPAGAHSLRECGRAMARRRGQFADLRYPVTPTLAHMLMRAYDGTDFGPSRHGEGAAPAGAQSLRECGRAMARRRGQFAYDWLSVDPSDVLLACAWEVCRETEMGPSNSHLKPAGDSPHRTFSGSYP